MALVKISVMLKPTLLDAQGRVIRGTLMSLGHTAVEKVRVGKSIEVTMPDTPDLEAQIKTMCDKLLANPIIEDYTYEVVK